MTTTAMDEGSLFPTERNAESNKKNKSVSHGQAWTEEEQVN